MNVKSVFVLFIFTLCNTIAFSQQKITWKELTTVYRKEIYKNKSDDEKINTLYYKEVILNNKNNEKTLSLKDVEGKKITIRGYFLDLGADAMWYMLSRFPFENCFFCTGVGPETVMELADFDNKKLKLKTDDIITVTGTLYLVEVEDQYYYTLKNCTVKLSET